MQPEVEGSQAEGTPKGFLGWAEVPGMGRGQYPKGKKCQGTDVFREPNSVATLAFLLFSVACALSSRHGRRLFQSSEQGL